MAIKEVEVPLYNSSGEETSKKLIVKEWAGRIVLNVSDKDGKETYVECYFDDLKRAHNATKRV